MTKVRSFRRSALLAAAMFILAVVVWGCQANEARLGAKDRAAPAGASESAGYTEEVNPETIPAVYQDRQIIQRATLTVRVPSASEAAKKAESLVVKAGGFVEASSIEARTGKKPWARLTLRVPYTQLAAVLDELEKLGTRISRDVTRDDVTTQLVDMDARLRNLRAQEETLLEIFKRATKIADVMEVQQHLADVRSEIERLDAQRAQMRELVALSTIELTLDESAVGLAGAGDPGWFKEGWASATDAFAGLLRELALVGVWLAVFSPFWLPFALWIVWLFVRSARRARSREVMPEPPA